MSSNPSDLTFTDVISPGRINLIGEHTDYNDGYVLPAAIELHIKIHLEKNESEDKCRIYSKTLQAHVEADLRNLHPGSGWENYILGVLNEIQKWGGKLQGFDGSIDSVLPPGAGLSSSAALECGLTFGLNKLFSLGLDPLEIIQLSQKAEHRYAGTQCGILDQFACVMGRKDHFILLDCRSMEYRYLPARLEPYQLLLIDSRVSHSHADSGYNQRREECRQGVAILQQSFPEIKSLRDASAAHLDSIRKKMPETLFRRCQFIIEENARVLRASDALEAGDPDTLGNLLTGSHNGLRDLYEVSCPEVDFLVDTASSLPGVLGARMMGGGFGGCSLNLVHTEALPEVREHLTSAYRQSFGLEAEPLEVRLGDGVRLRP
ncbi:MAG: galactokinase [Robiginitalea sp.]